MADWKDTCNLPRTAFSMKANLQTTEPETVSRWEAMDLYGKIREARKGAKRYVLHDGPPYANGEIHMGHALNKILKDLVVKSHNMLGFDAPYIPGWDCHGLPIENAIEKEHGRHLSRDDMQAKSRAYATEQIAQQKADFQRLGVLGDWDHPYRTMDPANEGGQIRAFKQVIERGFVYHGLKPVYWCFDCGSSLAEFEIEYADKKSDTLDVAFLCAQPDRLALAFGLSSLPADAYAVIWTTTAWTIPANQALNVHPELEYALVHTDKGVLLLAASLVDKCLERYGLSGQVLAKLDGQAQPQNVGQLNTAIFPNEGSHYVGMGREFYDRSLAARKYFDDAEKLLDLFRPGLAFARGRRTECRIEACLEQVTQQNAAMVEQSTAATHSLKAETAGVLPSMKASIRANSRPSLKERLMSVIGMYCSSAWIVE